VVATLRHVDDQLVASLSRQFITIPEVQHVLSLKGSERLFNSCLSYADELMDMPPKLASRTNLEIKPVSQRQSSEFDVAIHVHHLEGNLVIDISSSIMSDDQAANVANTFNQTLQSVLRSANGSIGGINLFTDRDYTQIVSWGKEIVKPEYRAQSRDVVHELVVHLALETPNAPAVCSWDGDLTYQQLIDNATKLAHYLVDAGAGPNVAVPVVLDKSRWAPVALLAVLM
jgi:non-ribosomal peptide synthetase component F